MSSSGERLKDEGSKTQVVVAGATAGLISRFCIAPLDVIKIRLQLQSHAISDASSHHGTFGPVYKGALPTFKAILRDEGITGLWKGNVPAELLYVCYGGTQFVTYRAITQAQAELPHRLPPAAESFISGAGAGALATTATYPLDLLRTRFAAQGKEKIYRSLISSIQEIGRHEGFKGFFQGLPAAIGQIVPYMGLFFAAYETFRLPLHSLDLPFGSGDAVAGIMASTMAKTGVFPLDLVRKRLQVQGPTRSRYVYRNIPEYKGVFPTIRAILAREGVPGLYRGLTVSLIKAAPTSAITMWTYERALSILQTIEERTEQVH